MKLYEDGFQYDVYEAIKMKASFKNVFQSIEELLHDYADDPASVPNNPLLTDYDWVYEHVEELFCKNKFDYQISQGYEAYYTFFRALIEKYPLKEDYDKYILENKNIKVRWTSFAIKFIEFISYSFDERLEKLLTDPYIIEYFLEYSGIYNPEIISSFGSIGIEKFLKYNYYASYYIENYNSLIQLIKEHPKINIPVEVLLNSDFINNISRTEHIETFYYNLSFVSEQICELHYLEEHKKYCDWQVNNIKDGILPCYIERYKNSKEIISLADIDIIFNYMEEQVARRIFERNNADLLHKKVLYKEMSKYLVVGMYLSRNFETDPYNLLIDIETLFNFAKENCISLNGQFVYDFLMSFESYDIEQIIGMYNQSKTLSLMEIFYDDWNKQKNNFINELNSKMFDISKCEPQMVINGIKCYDISNIEDPILVYNTSIPLDKWEKIRDFKNKFVDRYKYRLCLSVQDKNHINFYEKEKDKKTIKLVYGPLIADRVGTIYHKDAYSCGIDSVEIDNYSYKRKLYTLKSFMDDTIVFNEINYMLNEEDSFLPVAIISENNIMEEEVRVAEILNIPILFRNTKETINCKSNAETFEKKYTYFKEKKLFK